MAISPSPLKSIRKLIRKVIWRTILRPLPEESQARYPIYRRALLARRSDRGTRILIFAQGRTGTTLLESLLCSTGLFVPNDEPLIGLGRGALFPTAYVRGLSRDPDRQGPEGNFVCHVKPDHLDKYRVKSGRAPADVEAFVQALIRDRWYVVHVHRANIVRQVLSEIVGKARGEWHKRDDRPETLTVRVEREDLLNRIRHNEAMRLREQNVLEGVPHLSLKYEKDLLDASVHGQTVDSVLNYADLERSTEVSTSLKKINTRGIQEIVENFEEFSDWVEALGYGPYLDIS